MSFYGSIWNWSHVRIKWQYKTNKYIYRREPNADIEEKEKGREIKQRHDRKIEKIEKTFEYMYTFDMIAQLNEKKQQKEL